ncbi:hypothetical protein [Streptomyces sp. NPDC020983]|uniref:hypothetical protein n=1 Tax=Streptomyces sp. NPDC020983 TaxID=3365106 RepID=UPI0037BAAD58
MRTRTLTGLTAALTAGGLTSTGIGMHVTHTLHPVIGGLALILTAVPAGLAAHARRTAALTDQQRTLERIAGYRQGLMDAAAGILTTPSTRVESDNPERTQQ